jgi:hypothetical protein
LFLAGLSYRYRKFAVVEDFIERSNDSRLTRAINLLSQILTAKKSLTATQAYLASARSLRIDI